MFQHIGVIWYPVVIFLHWSVFQRRELFICKPVQFPDAVIKSERVCIEFFVIDSISLFHIVLIIFCNI